MKRFGKLSMNRKIGLAGALAFCAGFVGPAGAATAEKKARFYGGLDYFSVSDADDDIKTIVKDVVDVASVFGENLSGSVDAKNGYGVRAGVRFPVQGARDLDWGFSLGHVQGPKITTLLRSHDPFDPGTDELEIKTNYVRFLLEGADTVRFNERWGLRLGAGVGLAHAKTDQKETMTGTYFSDPTDDSKSATGFTWEISPALVVDFDKTALEVGLRYAGFPKIKESGTTFKTEWTSLGGFVSLSF